MAGSSHRLCARLLYTRPAAHRSTNHHVVNSSSGKRINDTLAEWSNAPALKAGSFGSTSSSLVGVYQMHLAISMFLQFPNYAPIGFSFTFSDIFCLFRNTTMSTYWSSMICKSKRATNWKGIRRKHVKAYIEDIVFESQRACKLVSLLSCYFSWQKTGALWYFSSTLRDEFKTWRHS